MTDALNSSIIIFVLYGFFIIIVKSISSETNKTA